MIRKLESEGAKSIEARHEAEIDYKNMINFSSLIQYQHQLISPKDHLR